MPYGLLASVSCTFLAVPCAATLRSAVRSAALTAVRLPRPGARRVGLAVPLTIGGARSPPPLGDVLPAGPRPSPLRSTAGRRAALVPTSAHALEACSAACPLHCLYARGDLRPGSELPPSLVHRARRCYRAVAWLLALPLRCPRAARRAGDTILARAPAAGARHHPASLGGGRRALACVCGWTALEGAGGAAATAAALLERALRRGRLPGRADESVAPNARQGACPGREPPAGPALPLCGAFARRRRCRLTPRNVPPGLARRRHALQRCGGLQCDPPRWQRAPRAPLVPAPGDWT